MKAVERTTAAPGNLHPDGAIRCPYHFHSVLPDENDRVAVVARGIVRGDQLAKLPVTVQQDLGRAFRAVFETAGIEITDTEVVVYPPEHGDTLPITYDGAFK